MDYASWPLAVFLFAIAFCYLIVAPVVAFTMGGGITISRPEPPLTIYDRVARTTLRGLGVIILAVKIPLQLEIVVPAPGFEWLAQSELMIAAVMFLFAGNMLPDEADEEADLSPPALFKGRLWAVGLTALALAAFYIGATKFFGE